MNKRIREVNEAVSTIKLFQVVGIFYVLIGVGLLVLAAWAHGLATAAEETQAELFWQPNAVILTLAGAGVLLAGLAAASLHVTGKARKALEGVNPGKADE